MILVSVCACQLSRTWCDTHCRQSRNNFEEEQQSDSGPWDKELGYLTHSGPSDEREGEHDRKFKQMLQTQLDSSVQDTPEAPAPDLDRPPWHRAIAIRVVSHRDFEFIVICITIVNCVGLALYSPLQPPTNTRNMWMDVIGTYLPAQQLPATH